MLTTEPLKVAVIGKAGHASRLISLTRENTDVTLEWVYYPEPTEEKNLPITQNIDAIFLTDAIIVSSPTWTHAEYLNLLSDYQGYILVEKPAVSTKEQTEVLRGWSVERKRRVRINYNLWHSQLAKQLSQLCKMPELGNPVTLDIHTSQGLAFSKKYQKGWRADVSKSLGVMELVGVHFVNLVLHLFGAIEECVTQCLWNTGFNKNMPPDAVRTNLSMKSGVTVSLFHSYSGPYLNRVTLTATDGYWDYDGYTAKLHYPRDTYDTQGRFMSPPMVEQTELPYSALWEESLKSSVTYFFDIVKSAGEFDERDFDLGLASMDPVFQTRSQLCR